MAGNRSCDACGRSYTFHRATSRFCSDHCRKRARRSITPTTVPTVTALATNPTPVSVHTATRRELEAVGRHESALGVVALLLARMLDDPAPSITGSQYAALVREHRITMADALRGAELLAAEDDPVSRFRAKARARGQGSATVGRLVPSS
jgi:hypothetical protein